MGIYIIRYIVLADGRDITLEDDIIWTSRKKEEVTPPKKIAVTDFRISDNDEKFEDIIFDDTEMDEEDKIPFDVELEEEKGDEDEIIPFFRIEKQPEFPGGEGALMQFLAENTKYPADAIDLNISGTVYVYFVINKQGKIVDAKIERGIYKSLDNEAVRVIKSMPNWNPGKQRSKPVSVSKVIPISFVLAN